MKTKSLFPHKYKSIGLFILIPSFVLFFITLYKDVNPSFFDWNVISLFNDSFMKEGSLVSIIENNVLGEILGILIIVGGLLVAFSKEKNEDEFITAIRLDALVWALIINYAILIVMIIFVYDLRFLDVMLFNMFTTLILFILKFNWELKKLNTATAHEE